MIYSPPEPSLDIEQKEIDYPVKVIMVIAILEMLYRFDDFFEIVTNDSYSGNSWYGFSIASLVIFVFSIIFFIAYFIDSAKYSKAVFYLSILGCALSIWKIVVLYITFEAIGASEFFIDGVILASLRAAPIIYWPMIAVFINRSSNSK